MLPTLVRIRYRINVIKDIKANIIRLMLFGAVLFLSRYWKPIGSRAAAIPPNIAKRDDRDCFITVTSVFQLKTGNIKLINRPSIDVKKA